MRSEPELLPYARVHTLERLEPLDELSPERLERRVPVQAWEAAVMEGDAEVLEERERPAVEGAGLVLKPEELAEEVFRDLEAQRGGVNVVGLDGDYLMFRA